MVLKEALREHFSLFGVTVTDEAALDKCLDLCDTYNLDEEAIVETWMAYSVSHCLGNGPTTEYLSQMERKELKREHSIISTPSRKNDNNLPKTAIFNSHSVRNSNSEDSAVLELYGGKTPTTSKAKRLRSPENDSDITEIKIRAIDSPFAPGSFCPKTTTPSRQQSTPGSYSKILLKYGSEPSSWCNGDKQKVSVKKLEQQPHVPPGAVYMYEKLIEKADALDLVCDEMGNWMCKAKNKADEVDLDVSPAYSKCQYQIQTYGRICCDSDDKKLHSGSILLEGTKELSCGTMMKLNLSQLEQYSIFPGQIVSIKGVNPSGNVLIVNSLTSECLPPPSPIPEVSYDKDLQIVVAAGPFTHSLDLNYQPLLDLIDYVVKNEPHVLILIGPFVDFDHQEIQNCEISVTFDDFFEDCIGKMMNKLESTSTQVILVASYRDVHHHPVYPTPEYVIKERHSNLHVMPDPCMIDIDGLIIGTTSVDSMMHLGREEISFNSTKSDRLTRLASHILAQKCFYPLIPPSKEVNLDTDLWESYAFLTQQPHILILPSSLRYFCNNAYNCLVMNPERLSKGCFARIRVTMTSSKENGKASLTDKIAVQILKI